MSESTHRIKRLEPLIQARLEQLEGLQDWASEADASTGHYYADRREELIAEWRDFQVALGQLLRMAERDRENLIRILRRYFVDLSRRTDEGTIEIEERCFRRVSRRH